MKHVGIEGYEYREGNDDGDVASHRVDEEPPPGSNHVAETIHVDDGGNSEDEIRVQPKKRPKMNVLLDDDDSDDDGNFT